jgi:hypothetical protein
VRIYLDTAFWRPDCMRMIQAQRHYSVDKSYVVYSQPLGSLVAVSIDGVWKVGDYYSMLGNEKHTRVERVID